MERSLCVVCLEAERTHLVSPCGHRCLCEECSVDFKPLDDGWQRAGRAPECPLCRESIERVVKVWD